MRIGVLFSLMTVTVLRQNCVTETTINRLVKPIKTCEIIKIYFSVLGPFKTLLLIDHEFFDKVVRLSSLFIVHSAILQEWKKKMKT